MGRYSHDTAIGRARPQATRLLLAGAATAIGVTAVLTGCASRPADVTGIPSSAADSWTLTTLEDAHGSVHDPVPPPAIDLTTPGRVSGSNGCASIDGTLTAASTASAGAGSRTATSVRFSDLVSPSIGCTVSNGIEARYGAALADVRLMTVDHDTLTLSGGEATLTYSRGAPTPSPTATSTPSPDPTSRSGAVPAAAQRAWTLRSDARLRIDLSTPGTIVVQAGCPGFTGDLAVTGRSADGAVEIHIARRPDSTPHCLAITAGEEEFVAAVGSATELRLTSTGLSVGGGGTALEFAPAG